MAEIQFPCFDFSGYTVAELRDYAQCMGKWADGTTEDEGSADYAEQAFRAQLALDALDERV